MNIPVQQYILFLKDINDNDFMDLEELFNDNLLDRLDDEIDNTNKKVVDEYEKIKERFCHYKNGLHLLI